MFKPNKILFYSNAILKNINQNFNLHNTSTFLIENNYKINSCSKIIFNFGFKEIRFEKKQMILYFFLIELLTNQKCVITTSSKNMISFKLKRGSVTGCKVTLRNEYLYAFLETLILGLPRLENFKGFSFNYNKNNNLYNFSTKIKNLFMFYVLEFEMYSHIDFFDISFNFQTISNFEKLYFFIYNKFPIKFLGV